MRRATLSTIVRKKRGQGIRLDYSNEVTEIEVNGVSRVGHLLAGLSRQMVRRARLVEGGDENLRHAPLIVLIFCTLRFVGMLRRIPDVFRTQRRKAAKVKHLSCLSGCVLEVVVNNLDATPTKKVSKNHANRDEKLPDQY